MFKKIRSFRNELKKNDFRVTIFGSARIKENDKIYKQIYKLSEIIGENGFDIVTGGGEGLMGAASNGHGAGDKKNRSESIGLTIKLPWESKPNKHLEIKKHYNKFSERLDNFMALSNVVIVAPGGIGTCLELFYTLQLMQVKHIKPIPVILYGKMWEDLFNWIQKSPVKQGFISPKDLKNIHIAKNNIEAMEIIEKEHKKFKRTKKNNHNYLWSKQK